MKGGGAELVEVVEDGVGRRLVGEELGAGMGAGGDDLTVKAGVMGGGDVEGGVADEQAFDGCGGEFFEGVAGELGHGFAPGGVVGAEDEFEPAVPAEVLEEGAGGVADFVGEDGLAEAAGVKLFEEPGSSGERVEFLEHDFVKMPAVEREGLGGEFGADEAGEGEFNAAADGGADFIVGGGGKAELLLGEGDGAVNGAEMVDEGAVEVVENGLDSRGA